MFDLVFLIKVSAMNPLFRRYLRDFHQTSVVSEIDAFVDWSPQCKHAIISLKHPA